jgi:hypothetical protein
MILLYIQKALFHYDKSRMLKNIKQQNKATDQAVSSFISMHVFVTFFPSYCKWFISSTIVIWYLQCMYAMLID